MYNQLAEWNLKLQLGVENRVESLTSPSPLCSKIEIRDQFRTEIQLPAAWGHQSECSLNWGNKEPTSRLCKFANFIKINAYCLLAQTLSSFLPSNFHDIASQISRIYYYTVGVRTFDVIKLWARTAQSVPLSWWWRNCGYINDDSPESQVMSSAANRLIGEVVQSRRRPLLRPSPGWKRLLALSHLLSLLRL